jgi:hypothetical protein
MEGAKARLLCGVDVYSCLDQAHFRLDVHGEIANKVDQSRKSTMAILEIPTFWLSLSSTTCKMDACEPPHTKPTLAHWTTTSTIVKVMVSAGI